MWPQSPHLYNGAIGWRGHPPGLASTPFTSVLPHQLPLPRGEAEGQIVLLGNSDMAAEGPFAVDTDSGFLLVTRALDREEQPEYQLQVGLGQV